MCDSSQRLYGSQSCFVFMAAGGIAFMQVDGIVSRRFGRTRTVKKRGSEVGQKMG